MKYALRFLSLGTILLLLSLQLGFVGLAIAWLGLSFIGVGVAFGGLGARVLGKRADGTLSKLSLLALSPFFLCIWATWHVLHLLERGDCCHEFAPGMWLGRRAYGKELPANISLLVDLTAEFPEPPDAIAGKTYLCVPILDASVLSQAAFQDLIETILTCPGQVYIHCAVGYGRSATVAAGVLLAKGLASSPAQAEQYLQKLRPGVCLNSTQRHFLEQWFRGNI